MRVVAEKTGERGRDKRPSKEGVLIPIAKDKKAKNIIALTRTRFELARFPIAVSS